MQKFIVSVCLALLFAGTQAVAQNVVYDANAQVRKVEHFTKIHVSSAISLYLSQGSQEAVAVSAGDEKYTARIRTEVRDGVLKIYVENGVWNSWNWGNRSLKAYVTVVNFDGLEASGASSVKVGDPLKAGGNFELEVSGASTVKFDAGISGARMNIQIDGASNFRTSLSAEDVKFNLSGASQADIIGKSSGLTVEASGASEFKGFGLETENCKAEASGASTVNITVSQKLNAQASGASSIGYKGDAVITNLDVSGASNVKKRS
jgi:hypothetical protein